jgi:hypothetical protein
MFRPIQQIIFRCTDRRQRIQATFIYIYVTGCTRAASATQGSQVIYAGIPNGLHDGDFGRYRDSQRLSASRRYYNMCHFIFPWISDRSHEFRCAATMPTIMLMNIYRVNIARHGQKTKNGLINS